MFGSFRSFPVGEKKVWAWVLFLFGITAYRCIGSFFNPLPFQVDEAQYVGWSNFISFGYYSKPPFIAWAVAGGKQFCAALEIVNAEGCARQLQPIAFMVAAFGVAAAAHQLTQNSRCAMTASLIFITTPFVGFYSLFVTTDAWLLMFWSLAFWVFILALKSPKNSSELWLLCGVLVGFVLLSKYSMVVFFLSAFCYLFITSRLKKVGPWIAAVTAFAIFSPNLVWNYTNNFPTIAHHIEISQIASENTTRQLIGDRIGSATVFLLAQLGLFGPLLFVAMLLTFRTRNISDPLISEPRCASDKIRSRLTLLHLMTWVILCLAVIQAFMSRSFANWAAPAYVSGSILAAYALVRLPGDTKAFRAKFILRFSLVIGLTVSFVLIHAPKIMFIQTHEETYRVRALEKLRGWREAALLLKGWAVSEIKLGKVWVFLAEDRRLLAALSSYGYPEIATPFAWNPENRQDNHYNWFLDIRNQSSLDSARFLLLRVSTGNTSLETPKMTGWQVLRKMDLTVFGPLQVGADGEHIVAFEVSRVR